MAQNVPPAVAGPRAIQTRYAGCHFRSRLEARWAVFFDAAGIAWEYEAEGFELEHRLTGDPGAFRYLPDFWLPGFNTHAEVKGEVDDATARELADAAAALGRLVVLYPLPRLTGAGFWAPWPIELRFHKGDLSANPWKAPRGLAHHDLGWAPWIVGNDGGRFDAQILRCGCEIEAPGTMLDPISAARSARFEFGRSGAT